jgi:energy-coupling factor transporter ATP-binding protein EcfA2
MDFYQIKEAEDKSKKGIVTVYPDFRVTRSKDLMIRAKQFYAIWDEQAGMWSQDEFDVQRLMDIEISAYEVQGQSFEIHRKLLGNFSSNSWMQFRNYVGHLSDSYTQLDEKLTFSNTVVTKEDYVSRRLNYPLEAGSYSAFDELIGVLYEPEERAKLEWAIGAIVSGDSREIQKFIVLYGKAGSGKSTILNIIQWLFEGYLAVFEAKALAGNNNLFATEAFRHNPLVAVQHDGDLSKIEDNTKLNSIISHEDLLINEKNKPSYRSRINAFLFMGTNKAVHITDAKSGIIRRLIDVHPSGNTISPRRYQMLMSQIKFELGAIAWHCLQVYREMGRDYYAAYRPVEMMLQTDVFYNFIEAYYDVFVGSDGVTLTQAYKLYKEFVEETNVPYKLPQYKFREELRNYFENFDDRHEMPDGSRVRSWYSGFTADRFKTQTVKDEMAFSLVMDEKESIFDKEMAKMPAQYSNAAGHPKLFWTDDPREDSKGVTFTPSQDQVVSSVLADLDTRREHFVKVPANHIVIDFDLTNDDGEKSAEKNLEAASQWPATYAEFSKSGSGIHLHYNYEGDPSELRQLFEPGIEVKVYNGNSSLRRRLTKCNNVPIATLNSGLPLKEKKVISKEVIKSEKGLRDLIQRNLRKEIHPGTKPSIDFIHHILKETYDNGTVTYDVTDMRPKLMAFANNSTHQALNCLKVVMDMKLASADTGEKGVPEIYGGQEKLVFFDVEVFKNLFVICWMYEDSDDMVVMINPTPQAVEEILPMLLVGYNCRRYDNHILYAASLGYSNIQLYRLSKRLIEGEQNAYFGAAYNISYTDIFDYASEKKTLKKWMLELGIRHLENQYDWDEPVPEEKWPEIVEYCSNDVRGTKAVHIARKQDFVARQILASLSGLSVNSTTQQHAAKIVFGDDRRPQDKFVYTDLSQTFPGYEYKYDPEIKKNVSSYRGENPSEGGYVHAKPGMYKNVAVLDVASMHPTSIEMLDMFGPYTQTFSEIKAARVAIKRRDFATAETALNGMLKSILDDIRSNPETMDEQLDALSFALKIVINIVYGLTAASFDNSFRDPRNIDNIVAKRGALFMIDLKNAVLEGGYDVIHIKTDSIKIPDATPEVIDFVMEFGKQYGYEFEHEATYEKMALVNDAVYVAKVAPGKKPAHWEAVGAEFKHPVVFKNLFSGEKVTFEDMGETRAVVKGAIYLDYEGDETVKDKRQFIGKVGRFVPVTEGGGLLIRVDNDKDYAVTDTKGYRWLDVEFVKKMKKEHLIDNKYYEKKVDKAIATIRKFGDFEEFVS